MDTNEVMILSDQDSVYYPPVVIRHRRRNLQDEDSNDNSYLQLVHECQPTYDLLHYVLLFPDGGGEYNNSSNILKSDKFDIFHYRRVAPRFEMCSKWTTYG